MLDYEGDVVERYGYDPFGNPEFYEADGTPIGASGGVLLMKDEDVRNLSL